MCVAETQTDLLSRTLVDCDSNSLTYIVKQKQQPQQQEYKHSILHHIISSRDTIEDRHTTLAITQSVHLPTSVRLSLHTHLLPTRNVHIIFPHIFGSLLPDARGSDLRQWPATGGRCRSGGQRHRCNNRQQSDMASETAIVVAVQQIDADVQGGHRDACKTHTHTQ